MTKHNHAHTIKCTKSEEELLKEISQATGETVSECFRSAIKLKAMLIKATQWPDVILRIFSLYEQDRKQNMMQ